MRFALRLALLVPLVAGVVFADTLSVVPSANPVNVGDTFTVDVTDTGATDLAGFQFDLSWDPTILGFQNEVEGPLLPTAGTTFFIPGTLDSTGGNLTFTADYVLGGGPGAQGNGTLATITFEALAQGSTSLALGNIMLADSNGSPLDFQSMDGSVTVNSPIGQVPESSSLLLLATGAFGLLMSSWWLASPLMEGK